MNSRGKRMVQEDELKYLQELKEAHTDPSAEWGGGGSSLEAGAGIDITEGVLSVDYGAGLTVDDGTLVVDASTVAMKSELATVATTGDYDDLNNKPTVVSESSMLSDIRFSDIFGDIIAEVDLTQITDDYTKIAEFDFKESSFDSNEIKFWRWDSTTPNAGAYSTSAIYTSGTITYDGTTYYYDRYYSTGSYLGRRFYIYFASATNTSVYSFIKEKTLVFIKAYNMTQQLNYDKVIFTMPNTVERLKLNTPLVKSTTGKNTNLTLNYDTDVLTLKNNTHLSVHNGTTGKYNSSFTIYETTDYTYSGNTMNIINTDFEYALCRMLVNQSNHSYSFGYKTAGGTSSAFSSGIPTISSNTYTYNNSEFIFTFTDNLDGTFTISTNASITLNASPATSVTFDRFTPVADLFEPINAKFIPVDGTTITVDSDGNLAATGGSSSGKYMHKIQIFANYSGTSHIWTEDYVSSSATAYTSLTDYLSDRNYIITNTSSTLSDYIITNISGSFYSLAIMTGTTDVYLGTVTVTVGPTVTANWQAQTASAIINDEVIAL